MENRLKEHFGIMIVFEQKETHFEAASLPCIYDCPINGIPRL